MTGRSFVRVNRDIVRDATGFELRLTSGGFNFVIAECVVASETYRFNGRLLGEGKRTSLSIWDDVFGPVDAPTSQASLARLSDALAFQGIQLDIKHRLSAAEGEARRRLDTARIWADSPERVSKYVVDYDLIAVTSSMKSPSQTVACHSHAEAVAQASRILAENPDVSAVIGAVSDVELFRIDRESP